ncbi:MAG: class I SAM-dependent methyltransferase [Gammaproteobacteria bacterium]|nr:class I SAM-dependent methyltransferase [Gammaproteobacteria bacterium]
MPSSAVDTSSISFTALYTGQVWCENGLSAEAFRTPTGRLFYLAMTPLETLSDWVTGGNIRKFLLQRHHLLDHRLSQALESQGIAQVLEIACGLSPRGWRLRQRYPHLRYVEADLPAMAARKQHLLETLGADHRVHRAVPIDIFASRGDTSLETVLAREFDRTQPIAVITEGLVNYFPLPRITPFWSQLVEVLQPAGGVYLTDNYPLPARYPFRRALKGASTLLSLAARSDVSFHFDDDTQARTYFEDLGFADVQVHNPQDYLDRLPIPRVRGEPLVRVVEGWISKR